MKKWIWVVVIVVIVAGLAKFSVGKYNTFIREGQKVDNSWGQVENVLQRRNDLIPNLSNIVQSYAIHEQEVFINVAKARSQWNKAANVEEKIAADGAMRGALLNLMAIVERYPDVKANQNFLALQDELAGTENRIAVERMRYNDTVQGYNTFAKSFPNNLLAKALSQPFERPYFKAEEGAGKAPKVEITYPTVK